MSWNKDYSIENNEQSSAHQLRMRSLVDAEEFRKEAFLRPLEYLVEDICESGLKVSLKEAINHFKYQDASEEAKACLNIQLKCRQLNGYNLVNWLQKIIDCFSDVVVDHIQRNLKETIIKKHPTKGFELTDDRAAFTHLQFVHAKHNFRSKIGTYFNAIYEDLNMSKHRLKRGDDDKIRKRKIDFYTLKEKDIEFAKIALTNLQLEFSNTHQNN
jgi:hypothetical protein